MSRLLTDAVVARLKTILEPQAVTVYDSGVPDPLNKPPPKFVVFYPQRPPLSRERLVPVSSLLTLRFQLTCVGLTRDNAEAIADLARGAVIDHVLAVPGWAPGPVQQDDAFTAPIRRDNTVKPATFYAIDQYLVTAVPA